MLGRGLSLAVAVAVAAVSLDGGGSGLTGRSVAGIVAWWAVLLAVAFSLWPTSRLPRAAIASATLLAAFAAFTGLSASWAPSAEIAFLEFGRVVAYLGLFVLVLLAARPRDARRWADGLAAGIGAVAVLALAQRMFPGLLPEGDVARLLPSAGTRLSYPIGYWNGLGILLALGVPLLLCVATADRARAVRALAVAILPAVAAAIFLTSSRGGVMVAAVGIVVFAAVTARRFAVLQALAVAAVGAGVAIAVLSAHPALVDGPPGSSSAEDEGPAVAALLVVVCAATGALHALLATFAPATLRLPRVAAAALAATAVVATAAAAAAADPAQRLRDFKAPPGGVTQDDGSFVQSHLLSGAGTGRWQFWDAAFDQFAEHPVAGGGAGSFASWWAQHGSIDWFLRNAHSLWLETLGELGLVGLALLLAAFGVAVAAGAGRLRGRSDADRGTAAALLAVSVAFAAGAGIDWIWQIPAIGGFGVVCLALLVGPATADAAMAAPRPRQFLPRAGTVLAAWLAMLALAIPLLVDSELEASRAAAARGDLDTATERAASARAIQPWAASPHLQLALVHEEQGDLPAARAHAADAIDRDEADWRLRVVAARLATKSGDLRAARAALAAAQRLNPRSPVLRSR